MDGLIVTKEILAVLYIFFPKPQHVNIAMINI